jgi:RNA polymerase sigma-B factor
VPREAGRLAANRLNERPNAPDPGLALESDEELLARYSRAPDPTAREELVIRLLPLAQSLARRYEGRGERLEDLEQVAQLGLLKAIDGFDERRGNSFRSYAEPTILGEIRRHFRDKRWAMRVPRDLKEALPKIRAAVDQLSTELGREPGTGEVAEATNLDEEEVLEALEAADTSRPTSLDAPVVAGDEGAAPMAEQVGLVDENLEQAEWGVMLSERLEELDERQREVLHLRFVMDLTQREIGERIGVSQMQVSRILRATLECLRDPA